MNEKQLKDILEKHRLWLIGDQSGIHANLRDADLRDANLRDADLRYADLRYADLRYADLRYADLRYANLRDADLRGANLCYANLRYGDLSGANLIMIILDRYTCIVGKSHTSIGCQHQTNKFWLNCKTDDIAGFSDDATEWWKKWSKLIRQLINEVEGKKKARRVLAAKEGAKK